MDRKCNHCVPKEQSTLTMPYVAHQEDMARSERTNKRLYLVVILLIAALLATNSAWIIYESQFENVVEEYDVAQNATGDGNNNSVINGGEVNNGLAENPLQTNYKGK